MTPEDDFLKSWVDQLKTMQDCMKQVNTDTDPDLAKFYAQKHADLLPTELMKLTFCSCFQDRTGLAINDDHFANSSTFRELLDRCYRPVQQAVIVVMRAVALSHDPSLSSVPEETFGTVPAARALPVAVIDELSHRLGTDMSPLYKAGSPSEVKLRQAIAKPDATVRSAAQAIL
jgi:hypothetical protein